MKKLFVLMFVLLSSTFLFADDDCTNLYPIVSPDGNYIYFISDRHGGSYEIFRVDIDGHSNLVRITNMPGEYTYYPAISPDGSLIAFQTGPYNSSSEIYIINTDGTNLTRLTNNEVFDGYPNFSPDGTKIVFCSYEGRWETQIYTMNIDGTNRTKITDEPAPNKLSFPIYNPSGEKIYFNLGQSVSGNNYVMMDIDGSNWVDITPPNEYGIDDGGLHFTADGSKIIFSTSEWPGANIVIADADGSNLERITYSTENEYFFNPSFHPTNDKIYYTCYPGGGGQNYSINSMNMDGTNQQYISDCYVVGIAEDFDGDVNLFYPNPVKDFIEVNYDYDFYLELYDLQGKLLLRTIDKQTNISQFRSGVYMAIVKDLNNKIIAKEKLIKQ